ncbi:MAG TPA: DUF4272 domain-containing protein [Planctomycetia bacterium]|nr:DUF4272 domain-containing protein [Planctomycetia bacterium]
MLVLLGALAVALALADDDQARGKKIKSKEERKPAAEATERRDRSIAILKKENVPFMALLPVLETEAESKRRTTEEVAERAMALCVVAVKGEGLEQEEVLKLVKKYRLEKAFTPKEKAFIDDPKPSERDRTQFSWRYECYWVTLWSLGMIDKLERPDKICDVPKAAKLLFGETRASFLKKAKLRSQKEIMDAADLIYRYDWAAVDARVKGKETPAGLDGGVIVERHHALNWLIGYMDQEWDKVSTDT